MQRLVVKKLILMCGRLIRNGGFLRRRQVSHVQRAATWTGNVFFFLHLVGTMYVADCSKSNLLCLLSYIIAILSNSGHGRVVRQADACNKYRVVLAVFNNYVCISWLYSMSIYEFNGYSVVKKNCLSAIISNDNGMYSPLLFHIDMLQACLRRFWSFALAC